MKTAMAGTLLCFALVLGQAWGQENKTTANDRPARTSQAATNQAQTSSGTSLQAVLGDMDRAAANFKSAQANLEANQYQKVVDEHDIQRGVIYFRRQGKELQMAADFTYPEKKYVLFSEGKVRVYQPRIEQATQYNAGKNKAEFESFLVLGFGGSGRDLVRSFDVRLAGTEDIAGVKAAKLELTPKSKKVAAMFSRIFLWIDPARGVSVQQELVEPSGDYRLAKYSDIRLNEKIPDDVFKLKTTSKTKWINP